MTRFYKVKKLSQIISNNNKAQDIIKTIYYKDFFLFVYNIKRLVDINSHYLDSKYNVDNLKSGAIVVITFLILLSNLKTFQKLTL